MQATHNSRLAFKELLCQIVPSKLHQYLPRGFEVVGTIAILEISTQLSEYETPIAQILLKSNKRVTTVVKKASHHEGEFRTQQYCVLAGENSTITQYRENGVIIELDINQTYFSTKLSTEREYLAKQVEPHTNQLVLFSGVAPYTFVITKQQPNVSRITSIELNPQAHSYAICNLENNKNNLVRNELFKWIKKNTKAHSIPIYDKTIVKNLNYLVYSFINSDVTAFSASIQPIESSVTQKENSNSLLKKSVFELYKFSTCKHSKHLHFNIDQLRRDEKNQLLLLLIYNPYDITFRITHSSLEYVIQTQIEKNYLLQLLTYTNKTIEQISKYDEVYMPLPKTAKEFLPHVFNISNKRAKIHIYDFMFEEEINNFKNSDQCRKIFEIATREKRTINILCVRKVGQASPRKYRVCIDIEFIQ